MKKKPCWLKDLLPIGQGMQLAPGPHEVHIWWHDHGTGAQPEHNADLLALLSSDERARCLHLRDEQRQHQFVIGRALCRQVLSRYAPVLPQDWRFALGPRGKPAIAGPDLPRPMWFSLSHTNGVSICAVTGVGPEIGVDIERIDAGRNALEIAEQFFPDAEAAALRKLPSARRAEAFVRMWALKESYVKARGIGLTEGLSGMMLDLSSSHEISVTFANDRQEQEEHWQFRLLQLDQERIIALAVFVPSSAPLLLRAQNWKTCGGVR